MACTGFALADALSVAGWLRGVVAWALCLLIVLPAAIKGAYDFTPAQKVQYILWQAVQYGYTVVAVIQGLEALILAEVGAGTRPAALIASPSVAAGLGLLATVVAVGASMKSAEAAFSTKPAQD